MTGRPSLLALVTVFLLALLALAAPASAARRRPNKISHNPVSTQYEPMLQNSLHPPMDASQSYFTYGGSTVATKRQLRLTPATQDRRGFVWNEYPLESDDFEVEVRLEIFSNPHFGGDGMGIWFLHAQQDPGLGAEPSLFQGNVFGLHENFRGVGVLIDVYDNDAKRNNPAIFVVQNTHGQFKYSHDQDFEGAMLRTVPASVEGASTEAYRCVADVRNLHRPVKMLIKYLHRILHVYLDTEDGQGYRFCLAVEVPGTNPSDPSKSLLRDHHLAFTAATGQVADNIDILEITTRYLKSTDVALDASDIASIGTGSSLSKLVSLVWFCLTLGVLVFFGLTLDEYNEYRSMTRNHVDAVAIAMKLNTHTMAQFYGYCFMCFVFLVMLNIAAVLISLPLLVVRLVLHRYGALLLSSAQLSHFGTRGSGILGLSPETRYLLALATYVLLALVCIYTLFN